MESHSFRAKSYLIFSALMVVIFYLILPQFAEFYMLFLLLSVAILGFIPIFLIMFDTIEINSSKKYWEIRQDDDTPRTRKKFWKKSWGFLCSYFSLYWSNFLISITSIFFLYKLESNNDPSSLIIVSTTIVILIRLLVYFKKEIAGEIGKGFRYAMLPLGFTLFLWDFLSPLMKKDSLYPMNPIYIFIKSNIPTIAVLGIALLVITGLEPVFERFVNLYSKYSKR